MDAWKLLLRTMGKFTRSRASHELVGSFAVDIKTVSKIRLYFFFFSRPAGVSECRAISYTSPSDAPATATIRNIDPLKAAIRPGPAAPAVTYS